MPFPFEVSFEEVQIDLDAYVDEVFACLESEFLVMPKGPGFIEYPTFENGYEALKRATTDFQNVTPATVTQGRVHGSDFPDCPALYVGLHTAGVGLLRYARDGHGDPPRGRPHH